MSSSKPFATIRLLWTGWLIIVVLPLAAVGVPTVGARNVSMGVVYPLFPPSVLVEELTDEMRISRFARSKTAAGTERVGIEDFV
jgi:hypothetical protein